MNNKNREKASADAYLKFLQSKGASAGMLYLRSKFLDAFMAELESKPHTREAYAHAIQRTRKSLSPEDKVDALTITREYFPFWLQDIKAIAQFEKKYGFHAHVGNWEPKNRSLKELEHAVDSNVFTLHETQILSKYLERIGKEHNDYSIVKQRTQLAKILLVRLRDAPGKNHVFYRTAIDLTLPLFEKNTKELYLKIAREFYGSWKNTQETFA